ncbi:MAG: deoxyribodipyrimidine photo-lyase [Bacteroidetes bacterium]|nr:deoxyribodipyrimidine photo-lyase [Bacteroidota bacterium]
MKQENKILFWFRNDLNIQENNALIEALLLSTELIPVFCFDPRESGLIKQDSLGFYSKLLKWLLHSDMNCD